MSRAAGAGSGRRAVLLPLLLLVCVTLAAWWRGRAPSPPAVPLPTVRSVVLLLAPGATLAEWGSVGLTRYAADGRGALAVAPTRAGGFLVVSPVVNGRAAGRSAPTAPPGRGETAEFAAAVRTLAYGSRSPSPGAKSLADAVRAGGGRVTVLNGGAAVTPLAAPPVGTPLRAPLDTAPFGEATDPEKVARVATGVGREGGPPGPPIMGGVDAGRPLPSRGDRPLPPPIIGGPGGPRERGDRSPTLTVAVYDDLLRADAEAPLCLPDAAAALRRGSLERLARTVTRLTETLPADAALLVVTPLPSVDAAARRERMGPVLLWRHGGLVPAAAAAPLLLASPSTRGTPGLLPNTDVAATITALLGLPPEARRVGAGRPAALAPEDVGSLARRADSWGAQAREQRLLVYVPWALAALLLAAAWRRQGAFAVGALAAPPALLAAAPLMPAADGAQWAIYAVTAAVCAAAGLLAWRTGRADTWARALTAATALLLLGDTLLGGPLLARSPLSYSVLEAARFYGVGNEASGIFLGSTLLSAAWVGVRSPGGALLAGAAVALTLGLPTLGADAGGLIAALAGFGAWALLLREKPLPLRRLLALGAAGGAALLLLIALYAAWDASRGAGARTHVGEAAAAARTRGLGALGEIAARKAAVNARLLVTSPWAALLAAEVGLLVFLVRRRGVRLNTEEHAALVAGGALFLLNDSGVVAAAACLLYPTAALLTRRSPGPFPLSA